MISKIEPQWEELGSTSPTPEDAIEVFVDGYKNPKGDDRSTGLRGRRRRNSQILLPQPPLHCRKLPYVPCRGREVAQARRFLHHARSSRLMNEAIADERFEDAARYRDEQKDIAPHSLLKCSSDATTLPKTEEVKKELTATSADSQAQKLLCRKLQNCRVALFGICL